MKITKILEFDNGKIEITRGSTVDVTGRSILTLTTPKGQSVVSLSVTEVATLKEAL